MTPSDLRALILDGPKAKACAAHVHTADMPKISGGEARAKDQAIADIINAYPPPMRLQSRRIGYGAVLAELGADAGAAILDKITAAGEVNSPIKWAMRLLDRGELDIGAAETQAQTRAMAGVLLTAAEVEAITAMGLVPETITAEQVSIALRGIKE